MSEEKKTKVIHVDKLIVKANEVIIEPQRHHHRPDPWFGFGPRQQQEVQAESAEENHEHHDHHHENDTEGEQRPPFSWI
ncbi:hypothetical protein LC040_01580 [Bacillus tianshenii]|nr:hypothetical protein LC040_01580 [Bacillus tianshenii]